MASSSTSSTQNSPFKSSSSIKHDVFLSFRGKDTRTNFTDHLSSALIRRGFSTYRDAEDLERGVEIETELFKAIEESRVAVIVFSRNYADSRWCLDELVKIMECRSSLGLIVVPVFYDVNPSDVREQRGSFGEAIEGYVGGGNEGKMEKWRKALTEAANLSGWDLRNVANGRESKFIDMIVEDISSKLDITYLNVATYPIGIASRVLDMSQLLDMNHVRIVGIWGIPGIGKDHNR